jgi:hypothetical protein
MISITYNGTPCIIRPTPLVSISTNTIRNKNGTLGSTYDIVLTGTIIADEGSPFYIENGTNGPSNKFKDDYDRPDSETIALENRLDSILTKQNLLRELFANNDQLMEIAPVNATVITCRPTLVSINFEEGIYVDICRYTINLKANFLLDAGHLITLDGLMSSGDSSLVGQTRKSEIDLIYEFGGLVEDVNETWSFEVDEGTGQTYITPNPVPANSPFQKLTPRTYRLTRNVSATGRDGYITSGIPPGTPFRLLAWEQAKGYVKKSILGDYDENGGFTKYPNFLNNSDVNKNVFAHDIINIIENNGGYNHIRTENIDKTAGVYSVSDTWLLSSGTAYENYNMSIRSGLDSPLISVSIDGSIKGLTTIPSSGNLYDGALITNADTPFDNAKLKYIEITNSGQYGLTSPMYRRVQNFVSPQMNSQPKSIALGLNEFAGEITYNLEFDNRRTNFISGVLAESININDTYPGDIFAIIPVLGRSTGPILQYIGSRTEYKRDVGIEFIVDYTDLPYGSGRELILSKPSVNEPVRSQLNDLLKQVSPAYEPGIRKYFLNPPAESWDPKSGRYSLNLSWVYELDH